MAVKSQRRTGSARPAPAQPTRIAADVYAAAKEAAVRESRSAAQQIDHWLRVGQGIALHQSASRRRIDAVLAGTLPMSALRSDERTVVNAELDAAIAEKAQATPFGKLLTARGVTTVALDDEGRLVEYRADGTTTVLDPGPVDGPVQE
jgi:hypothetical protein